MDSFNLAVLSMNSGRRFYCRDDKVEKLARLSIPSVMVKNARLQGVSHGSRDDMEEMLAFVDNHRLSPIERNIQEGLSPRDAAHRAMREVSGPIVAIALVLCAVFVPMAFLSGFTGQFYRQFAVTIAISTVISAVN
jgi:hypothetical protein